MRPKEQKPDPALNAMPWRGFASMGVRESRNPRVSARRSPELAETPSEGVTRGVLEETGIKVQAT